MLGAIIAQTCTTALCGARAWESNRGPHWNAAGVAVLRAGVGGNLLDPTMDGLNVSAVTR